MGMYDTLLFEDETPFGKVIPREVKIFLSKDWLKPGFQTKDLACELLYYRVDPFGRLTRDRTISYKHTDHDFLNEDYVTDKHIRFYNYALLSKESREGYWIDFKATINLESKSISNIELVHFYVRNHLKNEKLCEYEDGVFKVYPATPVLKEVE